MAHPLWPLFDLRLTVGSLELRLPTDAELVRLMRVARGGIHPPDEMPFGIPWTDKPSPRFEREFAQHHWLMRGSWAPDNWQLNLAVFVERRPIGSQSMAAKEFAVLRTVHTGSWLGRDHQGQGHGRAIRHAVLALAFDGLGAEVAESAAFVDNAASTAVSRAVGYEPNGFDRLAPQGVARELQRWRMSREAWAERPRPPVGIEGLDACLELFGITSPG